MATARARTACPTTDLAKEALQALAIERATGRPVTRADAPQLFGLHDQAMQAAAAHPLCRTAHFTSGRHRFYLSATWSAAGQVERVEVRNEGGALVLAGDAGGPIFLPFSASRPAADHSTSPISTETPT